ncbi:PEP-CTERM motif protein [Rubripirellula tenax]|uniref:PEP-CTERM motif protein n=1 Tax=Rubripirellula tenax TaxID=2528015 RepID=A0A5C6EQX6_9BACT|nr:PEP-CTERM sorting domain-containing protein [Rubripirellula tenax]TWU51035.1 PEP-CTERM motif protein [Rubripirellula tenax]
MTAGKMAAMAVLVFTLYSPAQAATVNGFANGGFENAGATTPAASWLIAASGYTRSTDARTGSFSASLMSPELNAAVMLQNSIDDGLLPPLTPGDNPLLSFWSKGFAGTSGNALFALRYLDANGVILSNSGLQFFQNSINPTTWTEITYDLGVVPVGAEAAFIEFSQGIGPIGGGNLPGTVLIDDVRLNVVQAVPEPATYAFLAVSGCVLLLRRRRKRSAFPSDEA